MVNGANRIFLVITILLIFITSTLYRKKMDDSLKLIITESGMPDSFDPTNADSTNNLTTMRMLYSSIIQTNYKNELISIPLKKFDYDQANNLITFELRENVFFNNNERVTANDIVLTILRVALKFNNFPVVKDIEGINEWKKKVYPLESLPSGIKILNNQISIKLMKSYKNPLFRFCLELFSVIPSSCIDKKNNILNCAHPSESGFYTLENKNEDELIFRKRKLSIEIDEKIIYSNIKISFKKLSLISNDKLDKNVIIAGNEINLVQNINTLIENNSITWMPTTRFGMLLLNPNISPFENSHDRSFFASKVRENLIQKNKLDVQASLFSKILPGFTPLTTIKSMTEKNIDLSKFKNKTFYVPKFGSNSNQFIIDAIIEVARELNMKIEFQDLKPGSESINSFINNKSSFMIGSSGFWPQDPIGDISMFFSKNLHKPLIFIWDDIKLNSIISKIELNQDTSNLNDLLLELNFHINMDSKLAPLVHFKRFFIYPKNKKIVQFPSAITTPAPWQLEIEDD